LHLCARQAREQHNLRTPSPSESTTSRNARGRGGITLTGVKVRVGNCLSLNGTDNGGPPAAGPPCGIPGGNVAMKSTSVAIGTELVAIGVDRCRPCPAGSHPPRTRQLTTQSTNSAVLNISRPYPVSSCNYTAALAMASQTTVNADSAATERSRCHDRHHVFQQNCNHHQYQHQQPQPQQQHSGEDDHTQLCECHMLNCDCHVTITPIIGRKVSSEPKLR